MWLSSDTSEEDHEWRGPKPKLMMTRHGRCKDTNDAEPFVRSKKSLGSEKIESFSSVPRDSKQVYRHCSTGKRVSNFEKVLEINMKVNL